LLPVPVGLREQRVIERTDTDCYKNHSLSGAYFYTGESQQFRLRAALEE